MIDVPRVFHPSCRQRVFRRLLEAAARPGTLAELDAELDGAPAWIAVLSVFVDRAVRLADPDRLLEPLHRTLIPALPAAAEEDGWVLLDWARPPRPGFTPELGSLEEPERGATLILVVQALGRGGRLRLSGPGIEGERRVAVAGLAAEWLDARRRWCALFPRGVDLVLADRDRALVLPRTTRVLEG